MRFQAVKSPNTVSTKGVVHVLDIGCPKCPTKYHIWALLGTEATAHAEAERVRKHIAAKCPVHVAVINFQ